ncbi:putative formin binding protein [Cryomyces antarcticus]
MSEYWKSTPKYWCKFCKTYVRDTIFEKKQHEATPRHQGNIQRSLRDLHRGHEREERDKQRAKDEVARLNGIVAGTSSSSGSTDAPWKRQPPTPSAPAQATAEDRKKQLKQLAEMGVAVPDEFRKEMAMAGDWHTVSVTPLEEDEDIKPSAINIGVRKRKFEGQEEAEEAGDTMVRKGWGTTFKSYAASKDDSVDIEALLSGSAPGQDHVLPAEFVPTIKKEESEEGVAFAVAAPDMNVAAAPVKTEDRPPGTGIVFKKRKAPKVPKN